MYFKLNYRVVNNVGDERRTANQTRIIAERRRVKKEKSTREPEPRSVRMYIPQTCMRRIGAALGSHTTCRDRANNKYACNTHARTHARTRYDKEKEMFLHKMSLAKNAACRNSVPRFYVTQQFRDNFIRPPEFSRYGATSSDDVAVKFSVESAASTYVAFRHGPGLFPVILGGTCVERRGRTTHTQGDSQGRKATKHVAHINTIYSRCSFAAYMIFQCSDVRIKESNFPHFNIL